MQDSGTSMRSRPFLPRISNSDFTFLGASGLYSQPHCMSSSKWKIKIEKLGCHRNELEVAKALKHCGKI